MTNKRILKENEMDRAQIILAARSVLSDLQTMAEKLARIEADGVMPLLDGIRSQFGPEFATRFNSDATDALRQSLESLKASKDRIGGNIDNMENLVTGKGPANDMAKGLPELDTEDQEQEETQPQTTVDPEDSAPEEVETPDSDLETAFGGSAMGREAKESAMFDNINMLRESTDPDRLIAKAVVAQTSSGVSLRHAVTIVAESFSIDEEDVLDAVSAQKKKNLS